MSPETTPSPQASERPAGASPVPELEPHCGSWIIVLRATGKPTCETYTRAVAEVFASKPATYEVLTAIQWLARFNASISNPELRPPQ